mmetsp:Transcript_86999/g.281731  ORF Transcript_86999/g.281731 Transcript_86999/m.281731 type:complete len:269 (+) Transcript_86999:40-846(+)
MCSILNHVILTFSWSSHVASEVVFAWALKETLEFNGAQVHALNHDDTNWKTSWVSAAKQSDVVVIIDGTEYWDTFWKREKHTSRRWLLVWRCTIWLVRYACLLGLTVCFWSWCFMVMRGDDFWEILQRLHSVMSIWFAWPLLALIAMSRTAAIIGRIYHAKEDAVDTHKITWTQREAILLSHKAKKVVRVQPSQSTEEAMQRIRLIVAGHDDDKKWLSEQIADMKRKSEQKSYDWQPSSWDITQKEAYRRHATIAFEPDATMVRLWET